MAVTESGKVQQCYSNVQQFTVTFNLNGKGDNFTSTIYEGLLISAPTTPTAHDYTFGGWYTDQECTNEYNFNTTVTGDITLYAKWERCEIIIKATPTGETSATVSGSLAGNAYFKGQSDYKLGTTGHYIGVSLKSGETFQSGDKIILDVSATNSASMLYLHSDGTGDNQLATISQTLIVGDNEFNVPTEFIGKSSLYIYREDSKCNPTVASLSICRSTSSVSPDPEPDPDPEPEPDPTPGGGGGCVVLIDYATSQYVTTTPRRMYAYEGSPSDETKYILETNNGNNKGQNSGANVRLDRKSYLKVLAKNATTTLSDSLFTNVSSISFKWKFHSSSNNYTTTVDVYVGSTKVASGIELTGNKNDDYRVQTISVPSLTGTVMLVNTSSNDESNYSLYLDDIEICTASTPSASQTAITLSPQGGSGGTASVTATKGEAMPEIDIPTRTGYNFQGYFTANDGSGTKYYNADGTSAQDWDKDDATFTLIAYWTANQYNITYKDQGGAAFSGTHAADKPTQHTYGTETELKSPTKDGYTFGGWFTTSDCTGSAVTSLGATAYTSDITLYAKWTEAKYTVTFNANGGTCTTTSATQSSYNASIILPTPTWDGYTFAGWYNQGELKGTAGASFIPAANITLYAKWTDNSEGKLFSYIDFNYGDKYKAFHNDNWVTANATGKYKTFTNTAEVQFQINDGEVDFKNNIISTFAKFKKGTTSMSIVIPEGKKATVTIKYGAYNTSNRLTVGVTNQTAPSNTFSDNGTNTAIANALQTVTLQEQTGTLELGSADNNIYIAYVSAVIENTPTTYTVTYNLGGGIGTLPTQAATAEGGTFTLASSDGITKSGYDFAGWSDGTNTYAAGATYTMPASNVTLTAQWTANKVSSITVAPSSKTLEVGGTQQLTATVSPDNALDKTVTWSTSNGSVATVSSTGLVTAVAEGTATITATANDGSGKTGTCSITVNKITPATYTFSADNTSICFGSDVTFTLAGSQEGATYYVTKSSGGGSAIGDSKAGTGSSLSFTVPSATAGDYYCYTSETTNYKAGKVSKSKVTITHNTATSITTQPTNQEVTVGEEATLSVVAAGTSLSYQWKESATEDGEYSNVSTGSGETSASYSVTPAAAGTKWYKCVVTGTCGEVTTEARKIVANAAVTYTVTYDAQGGTCKASDTGSSITLPTPTKDDYTFQGWYTSDGELVSSPYSPTADITLHALWRSDECAGGGGGSTTLFNVDFTDETTEQIKAATDAVSWVAKTYDTYNMSFGSKNADAGVIDIINGKGLQFTGNNLNNYNCLAIPLSLTKDKEVTVVITLGDATQIKYNWVSDALPASPNNGSSGSSYGTNNKINTLTYTPTSTGNYVLYLGRSGSSSGKVVESIVITQAGAGSGTCYYVTYNGNGADGGFTTDEASHPSGSNVTVKTNGFTKTGYTFTGWNTAANGSGTSYAAGATFTIEADVELFAQWTENATPDPEPDPNTSTITFDANGGEGSMEAQEFTHGAVAVAISACTYTKENYTFYGWNTKADGTGTPYTDKQKIQLEEDITLYAIWTSAYLTKVLFSNGFDAFIDNTERTVTAYYLAGTDVPTIKTKTGVGIIGDLQDGKITVTGLNDEVLEYDVTLEPVNPNTNTVAEDAAATAFGGSEEWVKAGGGYATDYYILRRQLKNGDAKYDQRVIAGKVRAYFYVGDASKLILTLDGSNKAIKYAIDGGEYTESSSETVTIELNKNNHQIEIISNQQSGDCHIAKYKLVSCIDPVFTVDYEQTSYTQGATANAITVSVTAGNSGRVDYQWYSNTTNDRSSGTVITGQTNASYKPSTAEVGTTYYWCEISNSCSTVKTAAIAITVSAAKSTPTVNWTDPTGVNYGGSGYSITAEVNDEWNGTLLPSMLTAPAGINIKGVTIADKSITATFDVTATFDRSQEKILFCLTLPETNDYARLVDEHPVDYVNCATGAIESYVINVLEKDNANKYGDYYYWLNTAGWIVPNPYSSCNSETKSTTFGDGQKFEYKHNTNSQTVYVRTFHGGVNKVRIYAEFRNPDMTVTGAYKHTDYFKTQNDTYKLKVSDYTIVYNGDANATSMGESGYKYVDVIFKTPLAVNDIIALTFDKSRVRVQGAVLETESGSSLKTSLQWSNSIANEATVAKELSNANFTYTAQQTGENSNSAGAITYSSSNPTVATVNAQTGEVSIEAAGTTTITATLAPSGCYAKATITYTLTVSEQTCTIASGTLTASKTEKYDCEAVTLTLSNYEQEATIEWWYNGAAIETTPAGITINNNNTLTTTLEGTYSVLVTKGCSVRSNSVTITNIASASATPLVSEWYIKNGRLTPPIALWKLEGGARIAGVGWWRGVEESSAPYDNSEPAIDVENGIVYLTGTPPQANETGEDIRYTIQLSIYNSCDESLMVVPTTITIVHQKNTDKHVLAFVVTGTEKGGFTEGIPATQTTNVSLYNAIAEEFDVLATNIYSTDDELALKEYYSRFDIICITDYPDTKKTGVNGKSYTDAMGALIDIRPILSMEAWVSKYSNWNDKGVKGDPVSPTTRQYSMLLQCKDHEIFAGTTLITEESGDEEMYRVTMVDKNQQQYKTLDDTYGATTPHAEKATTKNDAGEETIIGYGYGSNPALQGFTYTSAMSSMLPIGTIDDGDGNNLQVGLERQYEIEARMIVLGVNSYAMERLTDDGERVIINTLKYLMKKQSSEIADCSIYFDNNNGKGDNQWNNPENWAPSRNSLPQASQEARILAPCIVSGIVAKVASIKIVPDGKYAPAYNGGIDAKGSLTIAPDGALVVGGHIQAATAPNYYEARPTMPENLIVQADATGSGALIHGEENGEIGATVELVSKAYSVKEYNEQTGKYKKKKYWQYVALPVREALAEDAFWGAYTYQYDETKGWIKKGTGERIEEFWGVGLSIDNEVYSGANNNEALTKFTIKGNLALAIDRDIDLTKTPDAGEGQNMIGNSWTAPIHLTSMTADDFENAVATVYIYNTGRDEQASGSIGTASSADGSTQAGQWISIPVAATALDPWQGPKVIPAMQAFEVDLAEGKTSGILHLNYDKHVRTIATPEEENLPLRAPKYPSDRPSMIRLRVADSTTYTDLYLIEGDQFTDEFDNAWDGKYQPCDGRSATLYAMSPIGDMAVLAQPSVNNTSVVFEPGKKSEYVFTFGYNGDITYYLNDMQLKTSTEIKEGNEYRFTYNKGDMKNRFLVTRESFDSPNISTGLANIVTDGNGLQVTNPNQENLQVILIDAAGRLCSIYNTAEPMFNIELPATQGVYMINVKGETTNIVRKVVK